MKKIITLYSLTCLFSFFIIGQDVNFTQFHTNFLEVNPAFAGSAIQPRVSVNYRNQWPGVNSAFVTYSASYDQIYEPLKGGIGFKISNDVQGGGTLNYLSFDAMYSYQIKFRANFYLVSALQFGFNQNSLNTENMQFASQINPITGFNPSLSSDDITSTKIFYPDFAYGMVSYFKKHYFGVSVDHLIKPSVSFLSKGSARIDRKYSVNYGYTFPIHINGWVQPHYFITPSILFQKQSSFEQIIVGTYVNSRPMTYGLWIRQSFYLFPSSVIFLIGYKKNSLKFSYSYDLTLSKLTSTLGTHEIAFIYLINNFKGEQKAYESKLKKPWFDFLDFSFLPLK